MLTHVALFRLTPDASEAERDAVAEGLAALPDAIDEVRSFTHGPDLGLGDGVWDWAVVATFDDTAAWQRYQDHPAHQRFLTEVLRPVLAERAAVQLTS